MTAAAMAAACQEYDHTPIWDELREHEERIEMLEEECNRLNSNISALQAVLEAVQANDYVTDITKIMEDGVEVGYSMTFAKGGTITIYHGSDGQDAAAPKVGIMKASDGQYYWTSDDEWITDEDGEKIPAVVQGSEDGYICPLFRIVEGIWYISYDNGNSWRPFDKLNEEGGAESIFKEVRYDESFVYLTLTDGSMIALARHLEAAEVIYASAYGIIPGDVDKEKMALMLAEASTSNKTIRFNDGTYIFSSTIEVPSDVSIVGNTKTVFKASSETSPTILMKIHNADNVLVSHITLDGGLTARPTAEGKQIGMSLVSCRSVNIENVDFIGWSKQGVYSKTMSSYGDVSEGKFFKHLQMTNCRFYYNYCGNYFDYSCEYCQVLNCVWGENCIGTINCGGNNAYTSCQWNSNYTGFQMENNGSNPAHGGCNACTFNHNHSNAIKINDCVNGWVFEGCQIFYGSIRLVNCKGVIFNGNVWGSCKFYSTYPDMPNQNMITNTYFLTDRTTILAGNDGSTAVIDCLPYEEEARVVDLIIFMGQSNMSGFGGDASLAPAVPEGWGYEYKAISNPSGLLPMCEPFGLNEDNLDSGVSGTRRAGTLVSAFTNAYYGQTGVPVVGVSCSRGSTDTWFWMPGGKPLEDAISRQLTAEEWLTSNGHIIRNNYMVWLQGESDSALSVQQYKSNLIAITKEMIDRTGVTNCMIIRIGKRNPVDSSLDRVLQAQTELPQEYKEFVMASTLAASFPYDGLMSDGVHYSQEGYNILGADAGKNVAFYAESGIEAYMYDPHFSNTYFPTGTYKSIFDVPVPNDGPLETVYYEANININANDKMEEAPGRVAILDYFESYGKALNVSASFKTTAIGVRYYDADKKINGTWSNSSGSTYGRIVCYINDSETSVASDICNDETITVNGTTYILKEHNQQ